jgi:hypothetical protein
LENYESVPSSTCSPSALLCSVFALPNAPPPSPAMCRALTAPRRPSMHHVLLLHPATAHPTALASPRLAAPRCHPVELLSAAARRRCIPSSATSCFWQSPRVAPRSTVALVLPAILPQAPRYPRHCPSSARDRHAHCRPPTLLSTTVSSFRP